MRMTTGMSIATLLGAACIVALLTQPGNAATRGETSRQGFSGGDFDDFGSPDSFGAFDGWGGWNDSDWTLLEMQDQSISSAEESAREAGRQKRRDELQVIEQKDLKEHEAYFDDILETSQAALKAPRGIYYRKPGFTSAEAPPGGSTSIEVSGSTYLYDQGIFWLQQGPQYTVVTAPIGAVVAKLPLGVTRVTSRQAAAWYLFGTFFAQKGNAFEVIKPSAGTQVFYLPDGYSQEKANGVDVYRFGDTLYRPVIVQGILAYQVVG